METQILATEYSNGLLKATDQLTLFIRNEIAKVKQEKLDHDKFDRERQISLSGQMRAYNKVLSRLLKKRKSIVKYEVE